MRGHIDPQSHLFSYFSPEERVPVGHPLRSIKGYVLLSIGNEPATVPVEAASSPRSYPVNEYAAASACHAMAYQEGKRPEKMENPAPSAL